MTLPEVLLWNVLRGRAPGKPTFRRQHPVEPYILDFYCAAAKLCIEIDGEGHAWTVGRDERRDAWLNAQGIDVVRYGAKAVLADPDMVAQQIFDLALERMQRGA
jgi:very-short-patch-repair endonuclease